MINCHHLKIACYNQKMFASLNVTTKQERITNLPKIVRYQNNSNREIYLKYQEIMSEKEKNHTKINKYQRGSSKSLSIDNYLKCK